MVEVGIARKSGSQVKHGMELMRCLTAKSWEDRPVVLRQIDQIGEKSIKVLAQHGITSFETLAKQDATRLEILLNRRPPFGHQILASVRQLPKYLVSIKKTDVTASDGIQPVEVELTIECGLLEDNTPVQAKKAKTKFRDTTLVLTVTSDLDFIDFRRISTKALKSPKTFAVVAKLTKPSQTVLVQMASETIAGVTEMDLEGLEEDPDFWQQMEYNPSEEDKTPPVIDLTEHSVHKLSSKQPTGRSTVPKQGEAPKPIHERLPNGKYNCREGTDKPPQWSKKRVEAMFPTDEQSTVTSSSQPKVQPKTKPKTKTQEKPDPRLKQLEDLHKNTDVEASIRLSEGRRIKLDAISQSRRTDKPKGSRPVPRFDMDMTDLKEDEPKSSLLDTEVFEPSDDELPDVHEIVASYSAKRTSPSPETNYFDSETDELIRNLPSDWDDSGIVQASEPARPLTHRIPSEPPLRLTPVKRSGDLHDTETSKRARLSRNAVAVRSTSTSDAPKQASVVREKDTRSNNSGTPLFLPSSSDDEINIATNSPERNEKAAAWDGDFELDDSLFDIRPSAGQYAGRSKDTATKITDDDHAQATQPKPNRLSALRTQNASGSNGPSVLQPANMKQGGLEETASNDLYNERVAEFFAWLESDNVIIVDKMDMD
ncbi:hypothetical protein EIP86_002348 [Pleurotus ostreatoroseus]|nr:hypothetical protein EIP86_002348 [Pleurotus ostreatoroseus]